MFSKFLVKNHAKLFDLFPSFNGESNLPPHKPNQSAFKDKLIESASDASHNKNPQHFALLVLVAEENPNYYVSKIFPLKDTIMDSTEFIVPLDEHRNKFMSRGIKNLFEDLDSTRFASMNNYKEFNPRTNLKPSTATSTPKPNVCIPDSQSVVVPVDQQENLAKSSCKFSCENQKSTPRSRMFAQIPRSALAGLSRSSRLTVTSQKPVLVESLNFLNEEPKRGYHEVVGDIVTPGQVRGIDHLRDPRLNKGLAFTLEERQALGIHGLQPARFKTQEEQLELCRISIERYQEDLNKYLYLTELHDRNEKLFFRLLTENIEGLMPIVYTPTVGLACQKFGLIYRRPRGLFITINDIGHVFDVLKNWPEPNVKAIVVTDGERILGLGDLGACGMGIPVGKLALYTALAGIKPHECLPIVLDVGTNNQTLLEDPLYVGLRQKRVTGKLYDDFLDEFMEAVVKRYGQDTLIQFEDFANHNAFRLLKKYRNYYCTFNDDIQGTASVAVSGLMASHRITGRKFSDNTILFLGAGGASLGIADLVVRAMVLEGTSIEEARCRIWMFDIDGLLANERKEGNLDGHKKYYSKDHAPSKDFAAIVNEIKPSILIGASATGGAFTPEILTAMGKFNEKPVIFALSNPTAKAECTAEQAYTCTEGRCVFASGSPFPPVTINGKQFKPGQGNNAYIFPGVALGILLSGIHHISEDVFLIASHTVAENVTEDDLGKGRIYPPLREIHEVSIQIAIKILEYAYKERLATVYPKPKDLRRYVEEQQYNFNYEPSLPNLWQWPKAPYIKTKPLNGAGIKS